MSWELVVFNLNSVYIIHSKYIIHTLSFLFKYVLISVITIKYIYTCERSTYLHIIRFICTECAKNL